MRRSVAGWWFWLVVLTALPALAQPLGPTSPGSPSAGQWDGVKLLARALALLVGLALLGVTQLALWLLIGLAKRQTVRHARHLIRHHRQACLLWGLSFVLLGLILAGLQAPTLSVIVLVGFAWAAQTGMVAIVAMVGERLPFVDTTSRRLPGFLQAGTVVFLAACAPVVGWLLGLYLAMVAAGAYWLTLPLWGRSAPPEPAAAPADTQGDQE